MDLATLGYAVKTDSLKRGTEELLRHGEAARKAAQDAANFRAAFDHMDETTRRAGGGFRRTTQETKQTAAAIKLNNFQLQNMSFQMNDIAMGLATGQSPFRVMAQQGAQLIQIFGPGVGVGAALKATGTAMKSFLLNPLTIALGGFIAAAGAAELLVSALGGGGVAGALEKNEKALKTIKAAWEDVTNEAAKYGPSVVSSVSFATNTAMRALSTALENELAGVEVLVGRYRGSLGGLFGDNEFTSAIDEFRKDIQNGEADVEAFNTEIRNIANADPTGSLDSYAQHILNVTSAATELSDAIEELTDKTSDLNTVFSRHADVDAWMESVNKTKDTLVDLQRERAAALAAIGAVSPGQKAAAASDAIMSKPLDYENDPTGEVRNYKAATAAAVAYAQAIYGISQAYQKRARSYQATVDKARLELSLIGKTAEEQERARIIYEKMNAAREAALNAGVGVSADEQRMIEQTAAQTAALHAQAETWKEVRGYAEDFANTLVSGLQNGKNLTEALTASMQDLSKALAQSAIKDLLTGNFVSAAIKGGAAIVAALTGSKRHAEHEAQIAQYKSVRDSLRLEQQRLSGSVGERDLYVAEQVNAAGGKDLSSRKRRKIEQEAKALYDARVREAEAMEREAAALERLENARADLQIAYEAERDALEDTIARMKDFITTIDDLRTSLLLDANLSPLDPTARLSTAEQAFYQSLTDVRRGAGSAEDVQSATTAYLDEARSYFASSPDYDRIFQAVQDELKRISDDASVQIAHAETDLDLLNKQVDKLIDINDSVMSVEKAIRQLKAAQDAVNGAQSGGIIRRMAGGGMVGNGIYNRDSVIARYAGGGDIALAGGEHVMRAGAVNAQTIPLLEYMNRTGTAPPTSDDTGGARVVRALGASSTAQIDVMQNGLDRVARAIDELRRSWEQHAQQPEKPGTRRNG